MNKEAFYSKLETELNLILSDKAKSDLEEFCNFLLLYNQKVNITALKMKEDVYLKHFYDSLTISHYINLSENLTVLDIGSGGGFPGIVLKIVFPNLHITLLDSNHKKSDFQKEVIKKLNLTQIDVVNSRAEDYFKISSKYDLVVARAVANLRVLSELCIPFVKLNGNFLAMKASVNDEVEESKETIEVLGGVIQNIYSFDLPLNAGKRNIIMIKKRRETPKGYPRKYDQILKKSICKK